MGGDQCVSLLLLVFLSEFGIHKSPMMNIYVAVMITLNHAIWSIYSSTERAYA
jgi:hypothetical protein